MPYQQAWPLARGDTVMLMPARHSILLVLDSVKTVDTNHRDAGGLVVIGSARSPAPMRAEIVQGLPPHSALAMIPPLLPIWEKVR